MAQIVSAGFQNALKSSIKSPKYAVMIGWEKQINPSTKFFKLDESTLDGGDFLKGSSDVITLFDKYLYTDESKYVKNFSISKKVSSYSWGAISATATITLNNTSGRFIPEKDPIIGEHIKAGRPIKILSGFNGEMIQHFIGFIAQPVVNISEHTVSITAFDAMEYLSTKQSNLPAFVNRTVKEIIESLLVEQGFSADQYDLDNSLQTRIGYLFVKGRNLTDIFKDLAEAEAALMFVDEQGIIRFWNRTHLAKQQDSIWQFNYSNLKDVKINASPIINNIEVEARPFKPQAWQKLWELEYGNEQTKISAGQTKDVFVEFTDTMGEFYAVSVDMPVYVSNNTGSSYFSANTVEDGSGDSESGVQLLSYYNFGNKYRMTFKNNSSRTIFINRVQLWGVPAKVVQITTSPVVDEVSISQYGINPNTKTGLGDPILRIESGVIQNTASAEAVAQSIIGLYAQPNRRFDLDNFLATHLQIGDAIDVRIEELDESLHCFVMGYELKGGVNANFRQSLFVEERPQINYFTLNSSTLNGGHVLAA